MDSQRITAAVKLTPPKLSLKKRSSVSPTSNSTVSIKIFVRPVAPDLFMPNLPSDDELIPSGNDLVLMKRQDSSEKSTDIESRTPSSCESPTPSPNIVPCIDENDRDHLYSANTRISFKPCYSTPNKKPRRKVAQSRGIPRSNFVSSPRHILQSLSILDNHIEILDRKGYIVPPKMGVDKTSITTPKVFYGAPMLSPPPLRPAQRSTDDLFTIRRRLTESVTMVDK